MKLCTLKLVRKLYEHYNRKYFQGKLAEDVELYWASACPFMTKGETKRFNARSYGLTVLWRTVQGDEQDIITITFSDKLREHLTLLATTLLHEMVHVDLQCGTHGPKFKARRRKLMLQGAYDEWL